jgi:hypothetical protein
MALPQEQLVAQLVAQLEEQLAVEVEYMEE